MKTICIIKDERPLWDEIAGYLRTVNAEVVVLKSSSGGFSGMKPTLIIAGEDVLRAITASSRNIPMAIILNEGSDAPALKAKDSYYLKWPISREAFLELTSRLLYISERRVFNALITITHNNETSIGNSENFSLTGLAFRADRVLSRGDLVNVSFYIPEAGKVSLNAEVVRSIVDPETGMPYYGARFTGLGHEIKKVLSRFIEKGAFSQVQGGQRGLN